MPFHLHQIEESIKKIIAIQQKSTVGNLDIWVEHILKIKDEIMTKNIEQLGSTHYKFLISSLKLDFSKSNSILKCLQIEFYLIHILLCQHNLLKKSSDKEWLKLNKYEINNNMRYTIYDKILVNFMNNVYLFIYLFI